MRSGFLYSDDPKVSRLREGKAVIDETLGKRKYRLDDFNLERNIGCESTSQIWHVTLNARPEESYALKFFNKQTVMKTDFVKYVHQEKNAMLVLNDPGHPNVIRMIDTFRDEQNVYILYEYAEGGDLWEEIKHVGVPDGYIARILVMQLLRGLEYIHEKGIVHRDLKCENIVIHKGSLKIIDFGTSRFIKDITNKEHGHAEGTETRHDESSMTCDHSNCEGKCMRHPVAKIKRKFKNYVGTPNFMPPEAISNIASGCAADLWSLGCTIYQLLLGMNCFTGSSSYFIYKNVKDNTIEFPDIFDPDAKDLIIRLLLTDPSKRLSLSEVKKHKYLTGINTLPQPTGKVGRFDALDPRLRRTCCKIQEAIFDLTIKRENATEADHQEIVDAIVSLEYENIPSITSAITFNYSRTKSQVEAEIEEANKYMVI